MRRRTCISFFVLSVLSAALCISSCDRMELMPQRPQSDEGKTVTLRVIVPEPVVVDPMTRAGAGDFDKIRDLNIVAADGGSDDSALFEVYYADGSQNGDPAVEMEEGKDITIHFSEEFTGRYGLTRKKFYIVANYGRKIDKAAVTTVGLLKALKQESSEGFPGIPVNGCMMFAEAGHAGTHTHPDTGQTGLSLSAELRRTVATITVGIDGSRLAAGVSIVPRRISLHRVPVQCYLGMANKPYEDETLGIEEIGEQKGDGGELNWPMVVGDETLSSDQGQAPSWAASAETYAGGHYAGDDESLDVSDRTIAPLFMFENDHGGDAFGHEDGIRDPRLKRPAACRMAGEWGNLLEDRSTATCSYLEVEALYLRRNTDGTTRYGGTVRFRFFLGDDVSRNFDVLRDHYYKVTLQLEGNAVTEGGQVDENGDLTVDGSQVTWRVESDLRNVVIETGDIIVGGSGEYYPIDISGLESPRIYVKTENSSDETIMFVHYFNDAGNGSGTWGSLGGSPAETQVSKTDDGKTVLWIFISPWDPNLEDIYGDQGFKDGIRSVDVVLMDDDGSNAKELTRFKIVQYQPIRYEASGDYIEKEYGHQPITMYIDRVDREAMPWGFDGEELDYNANNGYANTYHLISEGPFDPDIYPGHGGNHRDVAVKYLPWGKQHGGSALIYATTLWYLPTYFQSPSGTINDLLNNKTFPDHNSDPGANGTDLHWAVPSIMGWQVIEKASIAGDLDPNHPVLPYMQYWTSNAVVADPDAGGDGAGTKDSYTYQFGRGLHSLTELDTYPADLRQDRAVAMRFRLVAIQDN